MGNPMARYMTEGAKATAALEKAKDPECRITQEYIYWKGRINFIHRNNLVAAKQKAKKFLKRHKVFSKLKPESSIHPNGVWDKQNIFFRR